MNIINRALLSKYSPLPKNYDFSEIMNYVPVAQEIWIKPLIGCDLMDELEDQVEHNNLSEENQALMTEGFLLQYLSYAVCLEGLPFIWTNFCEQGITLGESDHSKSITLRDLTYIQQHLRNQVEVLKDSVKRYICEHYTYYPKADVCACGCDCCNRNQQLNTPNPNFEIYGTPRKCTKLL